jgi:multiple sugar transport system permease protein
MASTTTERAVAEPAVWSRERVEQVLGRVFKILSIIFFFIITVFPFYWMLNLSFRPFGDVLTNPTRMLPRSQDFASVFAPIGACRGAMGSEACQAAVRNSSYAAVLIDYNFLTFIKNGAILSTTTVILALVLAVPAAYAVTRLDFRGRGLMSWGILLIYMFPAIVIGTPLFVFFVRIQQALSVQLRGNLYGVSIIYLASVLPVTLYMLRSYFLTIPKDLEEASMIDGSTRLEVIWRITIPLAAPAIASVALYVFMIAWNEFLYALLFLVDSPQSWTLPLGLQQLDSQEVPRTFLMAGSTIITVPVIFVFLFFERFMTEGLTAGGVKG